MKRYLYTLISLSAAIPVSASEIHYTATSEVMKVDEKAQINNGLINIQPKGNPGDADKPWSLSVYMSVEAIMNYVQANGNSGSVDLFSIADDPIHGKEVVDDTPLIPLMVGATVYIQWKKDEEKYTIGIKDKVIGSAVDEEYVTYKELAIFDSKLLTTATPTLSVSLSGENISGNENGAEAASGVITIEGVTLGTGGITATGDESTITYESTITLPTEATTFNIAADTPGTVSAVVTYSYYNDDGSETTVTNKELSNSHFLFPDAIVVATPGEDGGGEGEFYFDLGEDAPINPTPTTSVPEPATATLSLLALAGLAARRRRR